MDKENQRRLKNKETKNQINKKIVCETLREREREKKKSRDNFVRCLSDALK